MQDGKAGPDHMRRPQILALAMSCGAYLLEMGPTLLAFLRHPHSLPGGFRGDQAFYLWAIERARRSASFERFVVNCDWSNQGCIDLRAIPQEWNSFYLLGWLANLGHLSSDTFVSLWYYLALLLNVSASALVIERFSKNWLLAGLLSVFVGFQQSVLFRLQGHLSLVSIWPALLSLYFLWGTLEVWAGIRHARLGPQVLGFCSFIFLTGILSFYYLIFAATLSLMMVVGFCVVHWQAVVSSRSFHHTATWIIAGVVAVTGALFLFFVPYVFFGVGAHKHVRPIKEVILCSATWRDYVKPTGMAPAAAILTPLHAELTAAEIGERWPWELHSYLGLSLCLAIIAAIVYLVVSFNDSRPSASVWLWLAIATVTAFLGTGDGGQLIHKMVSGIRCFNRLSPFVALFAAAFVAATFPSSSRAGRWLAAVLLPLVVFEASSNPSLGRELVSDMSSERQFAADLHAYCPNRERLTVEPRVDDYMYGPYRIFYLAEAASCRLNGVNGPGFLEGADVSAANGGAMLWSDGSNGWEVVKFRREHALQPTLTLPRRD